MEDAEQRVGEGGRNGTREKTRGGKEAKESPAFAFSALLWGWWHLFFVIRKEMPHQTLLVWDYVSLTACPIHLLLPLISCPPSASAFMEA